MSCFLWGLAFFLDTPHGSKLSYVWKLGLVRFNLVCPLKEKHAPPVFCGMMFFVFFFFVSIVFCFIFSNEYFFCFWLCCSLNSISFCGNICSLSNVSLFLSCWLFWRSKYKEFLFLACAPLVWLLATVSALCPLIVKTYRRFHRLSAGLYLGNPAFFSAALCLYGE